MKHASNAIFRIDSIFNGERLAQGGIGLRYYVTPRYTRLFINFGGEGKAGRLIVGVAPF